MYECVYRCTFPPSLSIYIFIFTTNVFEHIQGISKIYKMNTKYQVATGPAQAQGRACPGPACSAIQFSIKHVQWFV